MNLEAKIHKMKANPFVIVFKKPQQTYLVKSTLI